MKKLLISLSLAAVLAGVQVIASQAQDVQSEKWATGLNHIQRVQQAGLMGGYPDGTFHPEGWLTRAELAHIVVKAFNVDKRGPHRQPLASASSLTDANPASLEKMILAEISDVPATHWAFNDIQTALRNNIMEGYHNDGRFYPNQKVTRAEAYAIFAQAYGVFQFTPETQNEVLSQYPDSGTIPGWAKKAVATALHEGFVNTNEQASRIHPLKPMTRGDMAFALSRYMERQFDGKKLN